MENKILLTSDIIRNKPFAKESLGYSIEEINKFLDVVANDYDQFEDTVKELEKIIQDQKTRIKKLEQDYTNISLAKRTAESELVQLQKGGLSDFGSVLKRINSMEENQNQLAEIITKISEKLEK